jgi:hypothetical protein
MRARLPGRILIVDDELPNLRVLRRLMIRLGYEVITASDGDSAVQSVVSVRTRPAFQNRPSRQTRWGRQSRTLGSSTRCRAAPT